MRHGKAGRKFGRDPSSRRAMFRSLAGALVLHERVKTTDAKAKELRRVVERLITKARRLGDVAATDGADLDPVDRARKLHVRRLLQKFLPRFAIEREDSEEVVDLHDKVIGTLAPRYRDRPGGYTRTLKLGPRAGDGAPMALIELIPEDAKPEPAKKGAKAASKAEPKAEAKGKKTPASKAKEEPKAKKKSSKKKGED
jgi:large subunit ribosomal protein L17